MATSSLAIVASWVSTNTFRATVTFTLVANTFQVTAAFPFALATPAFALVVIHTIIMDVVVIFLKRGLQIITSKNNIHN